MCNGVASSSRVNIEPEKIVAKGANIIGNVCALISLRMSLRAEAISKKRSEVVQEIDRYFPLSDHPRHGCSFNSWLLKNLSSELGDSDDNMTVDDCLRMIAEEAILEAKLIGCTIIYPGRLFDPGDHIRSELLVLPKLCFAILSKSSDKIFVASKTPNVSEDLLKRDIATFDPRIVNLLGDKNGTT